MKLKSIIIYSIVFLNLFFDTSNIYGQSNKKADDIYVVMLSLDGFRWDYADMAATPNLDYIAKHGVKASSLKPCFPSKTFPNHYSIATGLYPDNHGIVQNNFYSPPMKAYYSMMDRKAVENSDFYAGEPIWVTAEKQGITTASYFWIGSETLVQNIRPTYWKKYEHNLPFEQRIDSVIYWLQLPEAKRPHLITWYIHEPDGVGHKKGPESIETKQKIMYLDSLVGIFIKKIEKLPIAKKINIIITSDHGMGTTSADKTILLLDHIKEDWCEIIAGGNPIYSIKCKPGCMDSILLTLNKVKNLSIWETNKTPERLNFRKNPCNLDIVVLANKGWRLEKEEIHKNYANGTHGYDNDNKDMHGIFYGMGPAFKTNYINKEFINIDIYPLIAKILKLKPAKIDGTLKNVKSMLKQSNNNDQ